MTAVAIDETHNSTHPLERVRHERLAWSEHAVQAERTQSDLDRSTAASLFSESQLPEEFPSGHILHDKVDISHILEGSQHADQARVIHHAQHVPLCLQVYHLRHSTATGFSSLLGS